MLLHQLPAGGISSSEAASTGAPVPAFVKNVAVITTADLKHVNITLQFGGTFKGETVSVAFNGAAIPAVTVPVTAAEILIPNVAVAVTVAAEAEAETSAGMSVGMDAAAVAPALWTPESPNLHTVTITATKSKDAVTARFGLRYLGANSKGRLTVNGKAIKLKGYNRHTMSPTSGSALSLAEVQKDVELLVEVGANFVRGAHYPQDQRFLDLCDEKVLRVLLSRIPFVSCIIISIISIIIHLHHHASRATAVC